MIPEHLAARIPSLAPIPTRLDPVIPAQVDIDAVLFDVYGTLFISGSGDISLARTPGQPMEPLAALLDKFQIETPPDLLRKQFFEAIEASHVLSRRKGVSHPEVEIDAIWQAVAGFEDPARSREFAIEYELLVNPVGPMPHLAEVLAACREAEVAMGIISNAQFFTPLLFEWFLDTTPEGLGFDRDLLLYSWQWGVAKPSAKLFEMAARRLSDRDIRRNRVLYLGNDMRNDMLPARSAGFQTALFAGDKRSLRLRRDNPRCRGLTPDLVITALSQLATLINRR